jgi:hypothetical protein
LFFTERVAQELIKYEFPIPSDGVFTLITKHSENMIKKSGKRVFDIYLGGQLVHQNVDVFKEMGFKSGFNTYTEFEVKGRNLLINGKEIKDLIYEKPQYVRDLDCSFC